MSPAIVEATLARFGRLDILVNNAALRSEVAFEEMTLAHWRQVLGVTLDGPFLCFQAVARRARRARAGAIVNIGGLTAYTGAATRPCRHRQGWARRAHQGAGAGTRGPRNHGQPRLAGADRHGRGVGSRPPSASRDAGRPPRPAGEVAAMVRYLAGPNARYVTGQTLHVNGGAYLP